MDAPSSARPELPVPMDAEAENVIRVAAWIGNATTDDVFVSYTTLLLGVLHAPLDPAGLWQPHARLRLNQQSMVAGKQGLSGLDLRFFVDEIPTAGWPTGRPLFSVSARNVMQEALSIAQAARGSSAAVEPRDVMLSFLDVVPPSHRQQAQQWGLTGPAAAEIRRLMEGDLSGYFAKPAGETAGTDLPGYDAAASTVLRLAFVLAARRREAKRALLRSSGLLVALAESAPLLPDRDAAAVGMLRGMLGTNQDFYATRRDAAFDMPTDLAAAVAGAGSEFPPLSDNVQPILRDARRLAEVTASPPLVGARHLLGALVAQPDGSDRNSDARTHLIQAGVDLDAFREALARIVRDRHPSDDQRAWKEILIGSSVPVIATARPDIIPDDPRLEDTLDLRRYGDAIGALIAARDQKPPLSIAVFGPWGSGKSFFMRMIRAAVRDFEQAGKAAARQGQPTPFLGRIVQIEFNAWHYAEGNLWASLVHAILEGLEAAMSPVRERSAFQDMLDRLKLQEAAKLVAEARLQDAEQRLAESRAALQQAEQAANACRVKETGVQTAGEVLRAVQEEALQVLRPPGEAQDAAAWIASVGTSVDKAAAYLGRPELARQVPALVGATQGVANATAAMQVKIGAVRELLDEAEASAGRGASMLGWLANARVTKDRLILGGLLCGILLVALIGLALELERRGAEIAATVSGIAALAAPLLAAMTAGIGWARRHLADATRAFAVLGSIRERVEARQAQRLSERDAQLNAARRATAEAEAEAARRRAEVEAASVAVAKAQEDLKAATSAERLKRFVAQRLAEGDYQRHLGLIHTIRSDLEQLQALLSSVHPQEQEAGAEPPVERIVLFIDDLDRCPPARVVEVLEAVHLLLAFPLFVVVVGVDVRWVAQALRDRYPLQLGDAPGIASPIDYLEKVFQIPFWLPAMDAAAGRRLLDSAVGPAQAPVPESQQAGGRAAPRTGTGLPTEADLLAKEAAEGAEAAATRGSGQAVTPVQPVEPEAVAEALVLGRREREQLLAMAGAIGASPRRAKRFANLYRLLKASLSPAERRGFALDGGRTGTYAAAMILLALSTGAPRTAMRLSTRLATTPGGDLGPILDAAVAEAPAEESAAALAALQQLMAVADQPALSRDLCFWASRVTRFNFDGRAPAPTMPAAAQPKEPLRIAETPAPAQQEAKPARRKAKAKAPD